MDKDMRDKVKDMFVYKKDKEMMWDPDTDPEPDPDSKILPWMVGGIGTALYKDRINAKPLNLDHLKCPTFKEAQRVSQ